MGMAQTGEHGLAAARRLRAGGGITGLVTVAWLVEQEAIDADAVTPEEETVGMTDHFAALYELDSFRSPRFTCSRRSTTRAASNYWVIATDHPEKKLAKLAWRARLKLRTAGSRGSRAIVVGCVAVGSTPGGDWGSAAPSSNGPSLSRSSHSQHMRRSSQGS
jgi:hypothetical protein